MKGTLLDHCDQVSESQTMKDSLHGTKHSPDLVLEAELRRALERQEFRVVFQPICSMDTRRIVGFEALFRWEHPSRGLLSPGDFLQITEDSGLIIPIGLWVLRQACQQMHRWHLRFPDSPPLYLSVNVSSRQFQQLDLVEQIAQILQETGLNPASLKLEITETLVMQNSEAARNVLLQLRALNVRLAIDDFGTGYSSLSYLQTFPVHTLKIDRSFISKLQDVKESLEIVRAIVTLAHNLGLDVVAEGVETPNHVVMLKLLGCDFGQGHFYSQPVDGQRAEELISRQIESHCETSDYSSDSAPVYLASQAQKLREEFDIHIEDLKREATSQFDEGLYTRCVGTFQFLSELEPDNQSLRDYLELSKQLVYEDASAAPKDDSGMDTSLLPNQSIPRSNGSQTHGSGVMTAGVGANTPDKRRIAFLGAVAAIVLIVSSAIWTPAVQSTKTASSEATQRDPSGGITEASEQQGKPGLQESKNIGMKKLDKSKKPGMSDNVAASSSKTSSPKVQTERLEFAVLHQHLLGSCQGTLKIGRQSIVFVPAATNKHGFEFRLTEIVGTEKGDNFKIKFKHATYRFKTKAARSASDNLLAAIDSGLNRARVQATQNLKSKG